MPFVSLQVDSMIRFFDSMSLLAVRCVAEGSPRHRKSFCCWLLLLAIAGFASILASLCLLVALLAASLCFVSSYLLSSVAACVRSLELFAPSHLQRCTLSSALFGEKLGVRNLTAFDGSNTLITCVNRSRSDDFWGSSSPCQSALASSPLADPSPD